MAGLPVLKAGELLRALEKAGFEVVRQRGSHVRLRHADGRIVTAPMRPAQDIGRGLLRKILRDAELSPRTGRLAQGLTVRNPASRPAWPNCRPSP